MKRYRSMKIKEIIQHQIIETQEELAAALKREGILSRKQPFQEISKISCLLKSHIKMVIIDMLCPQRNRGSCLRTIHHFFSKKRLSELKAA